MKKLLLLLLLAPITGMAQLPPPLEHFETIQKGYWQIVVNNDTLPDQFNRFDKVVGWAREVAETYAESEDKPEMAIVAPDRWAIDYRFNYDYEKIPDTVRIVDSVAVYDKPEPVRNFHPTIERPEPDTTETYTLLIRGKSEAESVKIAYTCYDVRGKHNGSAWAEKDEEEQEWVWERELDCNTILTYWVMAQKDGEEYVGVHYIDVAHERWVGSQ